MRLEDIPDDPTKDIKKIMELFPHIDVQFLLQTAYSLANIGPTVGTITRDIEYSGGPSPQVTKLFPPTFPNWHHIDGTVVDAENTHTLSDWQTLGVNWHMNSCAYDVAMVSAIFLNIGICSLDILLPSEEVELFLKYPGAKMLKDVLEASWIDWSHMRNKLRSCLRGLDSERYPFKDFINTRHVLEDVLHFPQFAFTTYSHQIKCNGKEIYTKPSTIFHVPHDIDSTNWRDMSLDDYLMEFTSGRSFVCSCDKKSRMCHWIRSVKSYLIDRPSPTFLLLRTACGVSKEEEEKLAVLKDRKISFNLHGNHNVTVFYEVKAAIFAINSHFVIRIKVKETIYHLDGRVNSGKGAIVQGWWSEGVKLGEANPVAVFFRRA